MTGQQRWRSWVGGVRAALSVVVDTLSWSEITERDRSGEKAMGKTTNDAVNAREKARKAMLRLNADRAARDTRIEAITARTITASSQITTATTTADAARADARLAYEAMLTKIDAAQQSARGKAEPAVTTALTELKAEKLTLEEIAGLTEIPVAEVRRLLKSAPVGTRTAAAGVAPVGADPAGTEAGEPVAAAAPAAAR
jgi:hypothetical protein